MIYPLPFFFFFFFNDTATTEIYTLSLHDALPISPRDVELRLTRAGEGSDHAWSLQVRTDQLLRSEEHTSELQSQSNLVCRLLLEKKKKKHTLHSKSKDTRRREHARHAGLYAHLER